MKRTVLTLYAALIFVIGSFAQSKPDDVLLTIENDKISVEEFERVFNKNSSVSGPDAEDKSVEEYMDMFINFRLKVKEAEARGLDTTPSFKREFNQYVKQLQEPYLTDESHVEELVQEAYERSQVDLRASHIMIELNENANPEDTLKAYKKAEDIKQQIEEGTSFNELVEKYSDDPSKERNNGDLGWFSAFRMVYPFETAAYNTPVGSVSDPVRTKFGYHLINVTDRRKAMPKMRVGHIMIQALDTAPEEEEQKAEQAIEEIYQKLQNGEDFESLARRYSDDKNSARNGGKLPEFTTGKMVPDFENAVYPLREKGEITEPFRTPFGWHIAKLYNYEKKGSFEEEKENIKRRVEQSGRAGDGKTRLARKLVEEYGVKAYGRNVDPIKEYLDSMYFAGERKATALNEAGTKKVLKWKDKEYGNQKVKHDQSDFAAHLLSVKTRNQRDPQAFLCEEFENFKLNKVIEYEKSILEQKYPEYRYLKDEYRHGILLFDLMEKEVWKKAVKDTAGLEEFYEANKQNYRWPERIEAVIYAVENDEAADRAVDMINREKSDSAINVRLNKDSELGVKITEKTIDPSDDELLANVKKKAGTVQKTQNEDGIYVIFVKDVLEPGVKSLDEARGMVTSDYQDHLEKMWIKELRDKFDYQVNEEVMQELNSRYARK